MAERGAPKGNKNATKDKRLISDALRRVAAQNPDKLRRACEKLLDDAVEGNIAAFNTITDRLEGKPAQTNIISGDEESPLVTKVVREVVSAKDTDS